MSRKRTSSDPARLQGAPLRLHFERGILTQFRTFRQAHRLPGFGHSSRSGWEANT
jgi:hypothetical protein